jgi:outer membrane lipoprotein carrier protein
MKKVFLMSGMMLMTLLSFAQQKDPKAKVILDAVSARFKSYKTVAANFSYVVQNAGGKVLSKKNGVVNMKGSKYNIAFGSNKIMSDGKTVWNYDPASKEVTVNNANNSEKTITPQKLFTNFYDKDFSYVLSSEKQFGGKKVQEILLQPTDSKKTFNRVLLWIDRATNAIVSITVIEKSGTHYVYSVSNLKPNVSLSDAIFTFNKASYPGVEVVDLR